MADVKSCSIVGANGYIGMHLSTFLKSKGWNVFNYDLQETSNLSNYGHIDITDSKEVSQINLDVDYLFLFSGLTGTYKAFDSYSSFININEIGLLNVLNNIKNTCSNTHVVYPSTRLVYKGSEKTLKETDEKYPLSIYAINKISCEYYLELYRKMFDINYTIFRICVPYGNLLSNSYSFGTIGFFLNKATNGEPINLYGDGNLRRTFSFISDICKQIYECIIKSESINEIFNIGGETFSLNEVAKIIAKQYNVDIKYIEWPEKDLKQESGHTVFDDTKIKKIIGNFEYEHFTTLDWLKK